MYRSHSELELSPVLGEGGATIAFLDTLVQDTVVTTVKGGKVVSSDSDNLRHRIAVAARAALFWSGEREFDVDGVTYTVERDSEHSLPRICVDDKFVPQFSAAAA